MMSDSNDLDGSEKVDLAFEPAFALGRLTIRPALRQIVRDDDGADELLEPRVMQVLVALARAGGGIVTRDILVRDCWDGRIVGEDSINRVLSRIRRVAEGIGEGSFTLETVTKVGYRLLSATAPPPAVPGPSNRDAAGNGVSRRLLLGSSLAGLAAVAAGGIFMLSQGRARPSAAVSAEVTALMDQALVALGQQTREGQNQAIGLYRRVVALAPAYSDGWGALGNAYAVAATYRPEAESRQLRARARAAGERALALDPDNPFGRVAVVTAAPMIGHWLGMEQALRAALAKHGDNQQLLFALAALLMAVGRTAAAAAIGERMAALVPPMPDLYFFRIRSLWSADRLEEADRVIDEAASLYPTQFAIWFARFYILLYSGRATAAIALAQDRDRRPSGIPEAEIESVLRVARAVESRDPGQARQVIAEQMLRARIGAGYAENAIQFACALGDVDAAFHLAWAYYLGRGFTVPDLRFTALQGTFSPPADRLTLFLFLPVTAPMRADPRFERLVSELGLEAYWKASGNPPDFRVGPSAARARS